MLMWVSNRSLIIGMVHIWFCFLFLFCPTLFVLFSKIFIHRGTFYFVCTPSLFQPKMKRLVRRRSGLRRVLRARPTPRWRTRSSPRPRVRTPGRPSRGPTLFLTSTSQMFLAESSPPRRQMVTFKQNPMSQQIKDTQTFKMHDQQILHPTGTQLCSV